MSANEKLGDLLLRKGDILSKVLVHLVEGPRPFRRQRTARMPSRLSQVVRGLQQAPRETRP